MRYEDNPFNILHVSMRDSQDKILDKVEDLSLTLDEALCSQASAILTNPTKRLEAEVSWFPGYTPKKIKEAFEDAKSTPDEFIDNLSKDLLSYADVNAEILAFLNIPDPSLLTDYLLKIASDLDNVDTDALLTELNKERNVAGVPAIPNIDVLTTAVQNRQKELSVIIYSFIKGFGQDKLIEILTSAIEESTDLGDLESEALLLQLIEKYEVDVQSSLEDAASKVEQQIALIRDIAEKSISDGELNSAIDTLDSLLKAWDRLAQPIQVSMLSQGLEHSASKKLAHSIRQLALKLYNEHSNLDASKRIIELMKSVFAEVLTVAEKANTDIKELNSIKENKELYEPFLKEAHTYCSQYIEEAKQNPYRGYEIAAHILSVADNKIMEDTHSLGYRNPQLYIIGLQHIDEILSYQYDIYYQSILECLIIYGKTTRNWGNVPEFSKILKYAIAKQPNENIRQQANYIVKSFAKYQEVNPQSSNNSFKNWLIIGIAIIIIILLFIVSKNNSGSSNSSTSSSPQQSTQLQSSSQNPIPRKGVFTGYEVEHPYLNNEGLCEITIDNKNNFMPMYVRIWDIQQQKPVRAFYIRQGGSFTAKQLTPGKYEVRYRELYENDTPSYGSKSEPFSLEQRQTQAGTEYSTFSLTLYKVQNGNTRTERIDANDI